MMRLSTSLRILIVAFLLLAVSRAGADQITWSYGFAQSTATIASNGSNGATGTVVVTPFSGSITGTEPGSAAITAVNLQAVSSAAAGQPARFNNVEYTITMRLTDQSSGLVAAMTFEGELNGTISASGSTLKNTFLGQTEFTYDLNHHVYTVEIGNYTPPGTPGSGELGSIAVDVSIHHNPEPSAMVLAAIGASAFGLHQRRRRPTRR